MNINSQTKIKAPLPAPVLCQTLERLSLWLSILACVLWVPLYLYLISSDFWTNPPRLDRAYIALLASALLTGLVAWIEKCRPRRGSGGRWSLLEPRSIVPSILCILWYVPILRPVIMQSRERDIETICATNLKNIGTAFLAYTQDHDGHLPDSRNWCDAISPDVTSMWHRDSYLPFPPSRFPYHAVFRCPDAPGVDCAYTFNARLSGLQVESIAAPSETVLVFEGRGGWNSAGGPEMTEARHFYGQQDRDPGIFVTFVDGHVKTFRASQLPTLRWAP